MHKGEATAGQNSNSVKFENFLNEKALRSSPVDDGIRVSPTHEYTMGSHRVTSYQQREAEERRRSTPIWIMP